MAETRKLRSVVVGMGYNNATVQPFVQRNSSGFATAQMKLTIHHIGLHVDLYSNTYDIRRLAALLIEEADKVDAVAIRYAKRWPKPTKRDK